MELAAIVAKTWFSASFPKNRFQKIRPGPGNQNHLFRFFIHPKTKKTQGADRNPAQPRPETPSLWDGHRKSNTFFHQPCPFLFFRIRSLWKTAQRSTKQAHTAVFQPKTIIVSSFASKSRQQAQNKPQEKTILVFKGRQCVWNP